jgi:hypothetical protein
MERVLEVVERGQEIQVDTAKASLQAQRAEQNKLIGIDKALRRIRRATALKRIIGRRRIRTPYKSNNDIEQVTKIGWERWATRSLKQVKKQKTGKRQKWTGTPYKLNTDLIRRIGWAVGATCEGITLYPQQRNPTLFKTPFRLEREKILSFSLAVPMKCTEILRGINYARNIYLPKKAKLGVKLVKEAVGYLQYQAECLKLKIEADKAYEAERQECFKQIKEAEAKIFHAENEILEGLWTDNQKEKFKEMVKTGQMTEDFCKKIRAKENDDRKNQYVTIQAAEEVETGIFETLTRLNKAAIAQIRASVPRAATQGRIQHSLFENYEAMEA